MGQLWWPNTNTDGQNLNNLKLGGNSEYAFTATNYGMTRECGDVTRTRTRKDRARYMNTFQKVAVNFPESGPVNLLCIAGRTVISYSCQVLTLRSSDYGFMSFVPLQNCILPVSFKQAIISLLVSLL